MVKRLGTSLDTIIFFRAVDFFEPKASLVKFREGSLALKYKKIMGFHQLPLNVQDLKSQPSRKSRNKKYIQHRFATMCK